jgi:hypothetical protein
MPPYPKPEPTKKKKKRRPKSEYKLLVEQLDSLVRDIVHIRDKDICVVCGSTARPQAGHVFVRDRKKVRWALHNVHIQCARCNLLHRFDQAPYFHWFQEKYGMQRYNELYHEAEDEPYYIWSIPSMQELALSLEQELFRLSTDLHKDGRTRAT